MRSFEKKVDKFLTDNNYKYINYCNSNNKNDFVVAVNNRRFELEVKEKKQKYKNHWDNKIPERSLFIIDDLAIRRLFLKSPYAAIVVYDHCTEMYYTFTMLSLLLMPKTRVNRKISKNGMKGKWIVDLRNADKFNSLSKVFQGLKLYEEFCTSGNVLKRNKCLYCFEGEKMPIKGTTRTRYQKEKDIHNK